MTCIGPWNIPLTVSKVYEKPTFCLSSSILLTHACAFAPTPPTQLPAASLEPSSSACTAHALCSLTDTDLFSCLFFVLFFVFCEVLNDSGGSRGREGYHSVGGSSEGMNGYEELIRWRGREPGATCSTPLSRSSHNAPGFTSSSSLRPGRRPKGNKIMPISTCQRPQMTDRVHSVMYGSKFTHP